MSTLSSPESVKFIVSIIYAEGAPVADCMASLVTHFGEWDFMSEPMPFEFTDYYTAEMGSGLKRIIASFKTLRGRERLVESKLFTTALEETYSIEGGRQINIDPGYIAPEHLILATGKCYYHRPYLGRGVFADLTLVYQNKRYRSLEWTYPDYDTSEMKELFLKLRARYTEDLRRGEQRSE